MPLSEARKRANAKYLAKHKEQQKVYVARSSAKRFIKKYAGLEDLTELEQLIDERRKELINSEDKEK